MTVDELRRELDARGILLHVDAGRLVVTGLTTPRLRDEIRTHEPELLAALSRRVTCPQYQPAPGSRRCRSYYPNGACARPDELMCVEWLRANGFHTPR